MVLLLHILVALTSVAYSTYLFFYPSKSKLRLTYTLMALTLTSGTYLTLHNPAHLLASCATGLIYIGVVSTAVIFSHRKLVLLTNR